MLIAQQKRKENIAEYILYMWHIENIIRINDFDIEKIDALIISKHQVAGEVKSSIKAWYQDLADKMKNQGITTSGHLMQNREIVRKMEILHVTLAETMKDEKYLSLLKEAAPNIIALRQKSGTEQISDIEVCLNGLFGLMMMRIKKQDVNKETLAAIDTFSKLLAYLSAKFKELESAEEQGAKN